MDDALLVSRAVAGDLDSFGQLYDSYFGRVYDFTWRVLRDADQAADATRDVFLSAMRRLPELGRGVSFKPWLFTIAHTEAVTRAERMSPGAPALSPVHEEAFGSFDVPDACRLDDQSLTGGDHEAAALVWEAASALNARDYALLDLHVRQGLGSADIAAVMGVSKSNASTLVGRMKAAAGDVISSYIIARRGSRDCEDLQKVLAGFEFPPYTEPVRAAVDEHIRGCATCQASKRMLAAPLEILGAFAGVPAPLALKGDTWASISSEWASRRGAGTGMLLAAGVGAGAASLPANPYGSTIGGADGGGGGPAPWAASGDAGWDRNRFLLFGGAVLGLLIFAFGAGAILVAAFGGGGGSVSGGVATATRTAAPAKSATAERTVGGVSVETPTPNRTPSITPVPSETPTEAPPTEPPSPEPVATRTPRPSATPRVSPTRADTATRTPRGTKTATPIP